MKTALNTDRQSLFPQNVYDLDMYMFKIYARVSLVETCPIMPGVELPFGREHLCGKSVSDFRTAYNLACQKPQFYNALDL